MAEAVAQVLKKNYYSVDLAFDGEYGLDCAVTNIYDIIILGIMLPKMDGLQVLKRLREEKLSTPVILLTARGEMDDKVRGLDSGADDYLAKPFHTNELLARLRALSRRKTELIEDGCFTYGDISLNPYTLLLKCKQKEIVLTLKEAQILELLIKRFPTALSKQIMIENIWGYEAEAEENRVEIHISLLRKKLMKLGTSIGIRTIRNVGYILEN